MDLPAPFTVCPSKRISPESMLSSALMQRSIVDLPDPDGPATTIDSPLSIARVMSSSTRLLPKLLRTWSSSTRCPLERVSMSGRSVLERPKASMRRLEIAQGLEPSPDRFDLLWRERLHTRLFLAGLSDVIPLQRAH